MHHKLCVLNSPVRHQPLSVVSVHRVVDVVASAADSSRQTPRNLYPTPITTPPQLRACTPPKPPAMLISNFYFCTNHPRIISLHTLRHLRALSTMTSPAPRTYNVSSPAKPPIAVLTKTRMQSQRSTRCNQTSASSPPFALRGNP